MVTHPSLTREWLVILAGVIAAMHLAKLPPAIPALESTLGLSLLQAGFLLSLVQLAGMTIGILAGSCADSLGLRRSLLLGLVILTMASFLGGFAKTPSVLLGLRAFEGLGFLMVVLPAPGLVRRLVQPQRLSQRLGLWSCYMGIGAGLALLLGPLIIHHWGWSAWWWLLAVGTLLSALSVWLLVPPDEAVSAKPTTRSTWRNRLLETLSVPGPWLIALMFAMYSSQWLSVIGFLPSVYNQAGITGSTVAVLTALVAFINITGNLLAGYWLHKGVKPITLLTAGFSTMGVGAMLTFASVTEPDPLLRYLAVLLFSSIGGMIPAVLFSLAVRVAPSERTVSTTIGWMQQWSSFGQFIGPPAVAAVAVWVGGWQWTWVVTASCSVTGIVLAWLINRRLST